MEENSNIICLSFEDNENLRALLDGALKQRLDKVLEEKRCLSEENIQLKNLYANQGIELERVKAENESLYKQQQSESTNADSTGEKAYIAASRSHFKDKNGKHPSKEWAVTFWRNLSEVASMQTKDGKYVISNASQVSYVYRVVTEDAHVPYLYCGTRDDFATEWNDNVAERLEDDRKNKLTLKEKSLNAALNTPQYKDESVGNWCRLSLEGGQYADYYGKGCEIKKKIESFSK